MKALRVSIGLVLLVAVAALSFAAGTTENVQAAQPDELAGVDPSGQTVTFWHQHSREREEGLMSMIQDFNSTNEWDITVNAEYAGGYGDIYNKMIAGITANSVPDLVVAYQNQSAAYQVADALVDLTPYVNHPEYGIDDIDDFFAGFINQDVNAQFGGERLGFPPNRSAEVMYYNMTWLEELGFDGPPATWDEFGEMAAAATDQAAGTYGYALRTDASNVYAMVIGRGGEFQKADGSGYNFDTAEMQESMEFMKQLYDDGYARKIAERYGEQSDFANRKVLFTMGSTSGIPFYEMAVAEGEAGAFEWSVAPIPHTTSDAVTNIYGASVSIPKTTPERQLAAWVFVRWYTNPAQQARWVEISNYFPVRYSVADSLDSYFERNPKYENAFNILRSGDTKAEPPYSGYDEVRDLVSSAFNAILDGADIDITIAALEAEANDVHNLAAPE